MVGLMIGISFDLTSDSLFNRIFAIMVLVFDVFVIYLVILCFVIRAKLLKLTGACLYYSESTKKVRFTTCKGKEKIIPVSQVRKIKASSNFLGIYYLENGKKKSDDIAIAEYPDAVVKWVMEKRNEAVLGEKEQ